MRPGIERVEITNNGNGRGAYRFETPKNARPHANRIYRGVFDLNPGDVVTQCTKDEKLARYDIEFGVDILLGFTSGMTATVQEKILTWHEATVTVEYLQNPDTDEPGDWFKLKADYYFVGYARDDPATIEEWILLDWNKVKLHANQIPWRTRPNKKDGAKPTLDMCIFATCQSRALSPVITTKTNANATPITIIRFG